MRWIGFAIAACLAWKWNFWRGSQRVPAAIFFASLEGMPLGLILILILLGGL
jgi:hypothetical protein